jgi:TRAP-type mannitol/chloroaromatic compound transport system permease small subunit
MKFWSKLSAGIDRINQFFGSIASIMILLSCVVSAANALLRYGFDISNNWPLELQWYLFSAAVMLGASYTLKRNEHVRVDLIYSHLSDRGRIWVDLFGLVFFLMPACLLFAWLSWSTLFYPSWLVMESSLNSGGLPRYPIKFIVPFGFFMLSLQGVSEIIKRIGALSGEYTLSAEDLLLHLYGRHSGALWTSRRNA